MGDRDSLRPISRALRVRAGVPWWMVWGFGLVIGFAVVSMLLDGCTPACAVDDVPHDHPDFEGDLHDVLQDVVQDGGPVDACQSSPSHACACPGTVPVGALCSCPTECVSGARCTPLDAERRCTAD